MKSDLSFLIEIHTEDGFLESEIRFRISRSIAKSKIRISKIKIRISQSNAARGFLGSHLGIKTFRTEGRALTDCAYPCLFFICIDQSYHWYQCTSRIPLYPFVLLVTIVRILTPTSLLRYSKYIKEYGNLWARKRILWL